MNNTTNKPYITLKEIRELSKGNKYPYKEVAEKLNNLQYNELYNVDKIIAEGEQTSMKMVGIKKLFKMITNPLVIHQMKIQYNL